MGQKQAPNHTEIGAPLKKPWDVTIHSASRGATYDENVLLMSITRDFTCAYTTVWQAPTTKYFTKDTHYRL